MPAIFVLTLLALWFLAYIVLILVFHGRSRRFKHMLLSRLTVRKNRYKWRVVNKNYSVGVFIYYVSSVSSIAMGILAVFVIVLHALNVFRQISLVFVYVLLTVLSFINFSNLQLAQVMYNDSFVLIYNWRKKHWERFMVNSIRIKHVNDRILYHNVSFERKGRKVIIYCISDDAFISFISKVRKNKGLYP